MKREISIIIPSCNFEMLQKCINSIIRYTDFREVNAEFIIVPNGLPIEAKEWLNGLNPCFRYYWINEKSGECKSTNLGAAMADAEFIAKMDDDNEILQWAVNPNWIKRLITPFTDPKVGIVAPVVFNYKNEFIDRGDCVVGFLMVTRKTIWDTIGGMDTIFDPGIASDSDLCFRIKELGYTVSLPADTIVEKWNATTHIYGGTFPIYHKCIMSHSKNAEKIREEKIQVLINRWRNVYNTPKDTNI